MRRPSTTRQVADEALYRASKQIGGVGAVLDGVIFRPGGVAGENVFTTFGDAFAAALATSCTTTIYVDDSIAIATVPPGVYDGLGVLLLAGRGLNLGGVGNILMIEDGAVLKNWGGINNSTTGLLEIRCACVTTHAFSMTDATQFLLNGSSKISLDVGALVSAFDVSAPGAFQENVFRCFGPGSIDNTNAPTVPVISVQAGWQLDVILNAYFEFSEFLITGNEIGGPVGSTVQFFRDDTQPALASALFFGTYNDFMSSNSGNEMYVPAVAGDWSGTAPTSVANALDRIAAKIGPIP